MSFEIIKPFGPSIVKVTIPEHIISEMNSYINDLSNVFIEIGGTCLTKMSYFLLIVLLQFQEIDIFKEIFGN